MAHFFEIIFLHHYMDITKEFSSNYDSLPTSH